MCLELCVYVNSFISQFSYQWIICINSCEFHSSLIYMVSNVIVFYVQKFLGYFRPRKEASGSVISFFLSEGNTDKQLALLTGV